MRTLQLAVVAVVVIGVSFSPLAIVRAEDPGDPRPAWTSQMWGGLTPQGWGLTEFTITNPGPTITVAPGERVDFTLNSVDVAHRWHLDLNGNNVSDPGEPLSATFTPSPTGTAFSFNAPTTPGTYWYRCSIHGWDVQRGLFIVTGNGVPTVTISQPPGTPPQTWSGASSHTIAWTMSDPDNLPSQLTAWVNYSYNAGANGGTIAGPLLGVMSVPWFVPIIDATDVQVTVEVLDPAGAKGTDTNAVPNVDSTQPTVTGTIPTNGASGVPTNTFLEVTFSEPMNRPTAEGSVTLCRMPGCVAVPMTVTTWTGNTLRMQPTAALAADTQYQGTVSTAARDASDPGNALLAPHVWSFRTANSPPTASVGAPSAASRWTGGTPHDVTWTATDPDEPSSSLLVWVNVSLTGTAPWTAIAGPVTGDTGTTPWAVPLADVATARVNVTVVDAGGARTSALSAAFAIDSTAPTVQGTSPGGGATGVPTNANLVITFSERMDEAATGTAAVVGLQPAAGGAWSLLTFTWDPTSMVLTANPAADLAPLTAYRLFVNGTAQDASDPGNGMGTGTTVDFTTASGADTTPPQIADAAANPATQTPGGAVEISANVTDDVAIASVAVNVTRPDASTTNLTMALGTGARYAASAAWTQVGTHAFVVWASDTSGHWASAGGSFAITAAGDTTPPAITHTPPAGPHYAGTAITIRVTVADAGGVSQVRIDYVAPDGTPANVTVALEAGDVYALAITPATTGTLRYHFYAVDDAGNVAVSPEYTLTVVARPPAADYTLPILGVFIAILVGGPIAVLLWRRRKRPDEKGPEEAS